VESRCTAQSLWRKVLRQHRPSAGPLTTTHTPFWCLMFHQILMPAKVDAGSAALLFSTDPCEIGPKKRHTERLSEGWISSTSMEPCLTDQCHTFDRGQKSRTRRPPCHQCSIRFWWKRKQCRSQHQDCLPPQMLEGHRTPFHSTGYRAGNDSCCQPSVERYADLSRHSPCETCLSGGWP